MKFTETDLPGAYIIDPERLEDDRGFFARTWCQNEFSKYSLTDNFVQANIAYNKHKGILRGMHFQTEPYQEDKLVRCTSGAIVDVIIDLRPESPAYTRWVAVELTGKNRRMLYVPKGFAHGYQTLEADSEVFYQVSQFYTPQAEQGVRWDDPRFSIQWPDDERIISDKDKNWPDYVD